MDMDVKQNVNYLLKTTKNERINRKTVVVKSVFSLLIMIKVYHQTSYFMWDVRDVSEPQPGGVGHIRKRRYTLTLRGKSALQKKSVRTPFGMKWKGFLPFSHSYSSSFAAVPLSWDGTLLGIFLGAGMKWLFWRYCVDFVVCNFAFIWVEYGRMDGWMPSERVCRKIYILMLTDTSSRIAAKLCEYFGPRRIQNVGGKVLVILHLIGVATQLLLCIVRLLDVLWEQRFNLE